MKAFIKRSKKTGFWLVIGFPPLNNKWAIVGLLSRYVPMKELLVNARKGMYDEGRWSKDWLVDGMEWKCHFKPNELDNYLK